MMNKIIFILFLSLMETSASAQLDSSACKNFRAGNFTYRNDSAEVILITRKSKIQEEYNQTQNIKTRFKIRWLSSCSYQLKQLWSNSKKQRKCNGSTGIVMITFTKDNMYQYTCNCKYEPELKTSLGTVYKLP